ncbi:MULTISPECIES: hypothetical protein [unclassified Coleofasciculus]|uniref:hypothetical protein n=1 Tax=unclassified Coleofasciculus TaxID=2692782 RepID=UPI0018828023|nr:MULTISPECIES: hypothetical protein [unclassified Coleofasciculus]MBE9127154.1 hypothetical protein [Coleofasciculus sp. LEGE 07081]MBE9150291.1 hypothetical protein [Coleofasciculus sp. LEGE 07092]
MRFTFIALTTVFASIGFITQATAQVRTPTQEFFEQGWEQLEREIQNLQGERPNSEVNLQQQQADESKPLLEVNPTLPSEPSQTPTEIESPKPNPDK